MSMKRFVFFYQVAATFLYFQSKQNGVEFYRVLYRSGTLYGNITCIFIISYSFYNYECTLCVLIHNVPTVLRAFGENDGIRRATKSTLD